METNETFFTLNYVPEIILFLGFIIFVATIIFIIFLIKKGLEKKRIKKEKEKNKEMEKRRKIEEKEKEMVRNNRIAEISASSLFTAQDILFLVRNNVKYHELDKKLKKKILNIDLLLFFVEVSQIKRQVSFDGNLVTALGFYNQLFKESFDDNFLQEIISLVNKSLTEIERLEKEGYAGSSQLKKTFFENCSRITKRI